MPEDTAFHKNILNNMSDGVMTLDFNGQIIMFNPAAAAIIGLKAETVLKRPFAEVFMMELEGNDDFNQTVLDAVYQTGVGLSRVLEFTRPDGQTLTLSVTSSFLKEGGESNESKGVIVVFRDITELKKLQDQEKELNKRLGDAYIKLEESNESLKAALRKVQFIRIGATAFVILLFLGIGVFFWSSGSGGGSSRPASASTIPKDAENVPTVVAQTRPISSSVSLSGKVEPIKEVNLVSPFAGKVKERYFNYGQQVEKGEKLLQLDTQELQVKLRDARSAYIKAEQHYQGIANWHNSNEVSQARRSHARAANALEQARSKVEETELLFDKGIVPATEMQSVRDQYLNQQMEFQAAQEGLDAVLEKGNEENVDIAQMELANAQTRLDELEAQFEKSTISAPVDGIVIMPTAGSSGDSKKTVMEDGVSVNQGDILVAVANLEGLTVNSSVDEVDIGKIRIGQNVKVSGDAFPDIQLEGRVTHVSSQAKGGSGYGSVPTFEVEVTIDKLTPDQAQRIRLGMSTNLQVVVYENPESLLIPIPSVRTMGDEHFVTVRDSATGEFKEVQVQTGMTTIDSVEILSGLKPGDEVVIRPGVF